MDAVTKRQDMPPSGGYKPIYYKRIPARSYFNGWSILAGYLGLTAFGAYVYYLNCKLVQKHDIETRSANFAILPLLLAERDRAFLKQLRKNRDDEGELMKNVEGWKVGTYYGEPVYKEFDKFIEPSIQEYYVHSNYLQYARRNFFGMLA